MHHRYVGDFLFGIVSYNPMMTGQAERLPIVKNAVLLHGGSITVRPADKGGLAFEFTLRK